jgi:hypothetical protein
MVDMGGAGGGVVTPSIQQYCLKWNNHQVGSSQCCGTVMVYCGSGFGSSSCSGSGVGSGSKQYLAELFNDKFF